MLMLVEDAKERARAQRQLEEALKEGLGRAGTRNVGFPGDNFDLPLFSGGHGKLWAAFLKPVKDGRGISRYWNAFGVFDENAPAQSITVEANIAAESDSHRVAGFFATDAQNGEVVLMHSGKIGGGRKGIGRTAFLVWSHARLVEASGERRQREGIPIANLNRDDVVERVWRFVRKVEEFKREAASGALDTKDFKEREKRYFREFAGEKKGSRSKTLAYLTYHGDVVDALYQRLTTNAGRGERVFNSQLIDLYVLKGGVKTKVYEVKPCGDRQSLYTAIGQLVTHGAASRKVLVLPAEAAIPADVKSALKNLEIECEWFQLRKGEVEFLAVAR